MTIHEFKQKATEMLSDITDNPQFEAEQLIMSSLGISRNCLLIDRNKQLNENEYNKLEDLFKRRLSREPLQYICGEWEFCGLKMFCGKGCLIPRPETEMLVEYAVKNLPENGLLLDLCTGSGCIAVSVLQKRPDIKAVAVDISEDALYYARKNADFHNVSSRIKFICGDILDYVPEISPDVIVSNPPYIKTADIKSLSPEVQREPYIALDGGADGLIFYRAIAKKAGKHINENGVILLEVGYDIANDVCAVFDAENYYTTLANDCFGVERMCIARKQSGR